MSHQQKILVTAIIIEDKKILLQKRSDNIASHKNKWTTPSGFVKENEHPRNTIVREIKEETGVDIRIIKMLPVVDSFPNHKNKYHMIYLSFLCKIINGSPANTDRDGDILEIEWFELANLDKVDLIRGTMPPIEYLLNEKDFQK